MIETSGLGPSDLLLLAFGFGTLALMLWAVVDACLRPAAAFPAAGKLTKPAWVAILAVALVFGWFGFGGLLALVGTVAAIVYLVDVRPAVREMRRGGPWG